MSQIVGPLSSFSYCLLYIEKSEYDQEIPQSLSKPCDAKQPSSGCFFLSYPLTHDRFLYYHVLIIYFRIRREKDVCEDRFCELVVGFSTTFFESHVSVEIL